MNTGEVTQIDHNAYPKKCRKMDDAGLRWTIKDCKEAIAAMPNGHKAGYYADEIHYCAMELTRRENLAVRKARVPVKWS